MLIYFHYAPFVIHIVSFMSLNISKFDDLLLLCHFLGHYDNLIAIHDWNGLMLVQIKLYISVIKV